MAGAPEEEPDRLEAVAEAKERRCGLAKRATETRAHEPEPRTRADEGGAHQQRAQMRGRDTGAPGRGSEEGRIRRDGREAERRGWPAGRWGVSWTMLTGRGDTARREATRVFALVLRWSRCHSYRNLMPGHRSAREI